VLGERRADYGKRVVVTLAGQLTAEFGKGFTRDNLLRMLQFAEVFPDRQIVGTLSRQLGWSHFVTLLPLKEPLQREFYAEMCAQERWSVRALQNKIQGMLYERTALSKNTEELVRQELAALRESDRMSPELVFRNPYLLDFLGLADTYSEKDLEAAILRELEGFLLELGEGFAFVARQKRMVIDGKDFNLDLLFYHRDLRRLVAVELKIGEFKPGDKGQMELYLRWLDRYERRSEEEPPVGLILCSEAGPEQVALLQLDRGDIRVAQYLTEKLPQPLLEARLREAVRRGREQLAHREPPVLAEPEERENEGESAP
jgi:predicted nuclease of restriction endonuclease-like (RecB) superfamily